MCGRPLYTMRDFVRGKLLTWAYSVPANVEGTPATLYFLERFSYLPFLYRPITP